MKKTVVIGANDNPERYSNKAVRMLNRFGHEVVPVGLRKGNISGIEIHSDMPAVTGTDTVTLYVGPQNQPYWYDYILSLKPKRIIFNPGTENPELERKAEEAGIETLEACTLVMLSINNY
ncbi:MAG: CoA-binding protein [Bacteroidota bacterium]